MPDPIAEAETRLQHLCGLTPTAATHAVSETLDCLGFELDEYIARRHTELQGAGCTGEQIYQRIADELPRLRFKAPALSVRQIRRRIYG